jgi:hypothetical protein
MAFEKGCILRAKGASIDKVLFFAHGVVLAVVVAGDYTK